MKCEVCKAIEKLGLDGSVHESWYCVDVEESSRLAVTMKKSCLIRKCRERWVRMKQVAFPMPVRVQPEQQRVRFLLRLRHLLTH